MMTIDKVSALLDSREVTREDMKMILTNRITQRCTELLMKKPRPSKPRAAKNQPFHV